MGPIIYEKDPREQARGGPVATGKGGFDSESKRERERGSDDANSVFLGAWDPRWKLTPENDKEI